MVLALIVSYLTLGLIFGGGLAIAVKKHKGKDWDRGDTATVPIAILFWPVLLIKVIDMTVRGK